MNEEVVIKLITGPVTEIVLDPESEDPIWVVAVSRLSDNFETGSPIFQVDIREDSRGDRDSILTLQVEPYADKEVHIMVMNRTRVALL